MDLLYAVVIGLIQGVAEWLPISSKTQIMLVSTHLNIPPSTGYTLGLFMEAASVAAALIYFRHIYRQVLRGFLGDAVGRMWLKYIVVTTLTTAAFGVPLYYISKNTLIGAAAGWLMAALGVVVILNGVVLQRARNRAGLKDFTNMSLRDMFLVGVAQALSVVPGVSRSGTTTTTLLLLGYKPEEAFKASFILVPVAGLGAAALTYLDLGRAVLTQEALVALAVGTLMSIATIEILMKFAKKSQVVLVNIVVGILALLGGLLAI
ncbi:MAG: undecaprenyl-diphosphate phosphatase [Pyrobaculum sp.]